MAMVNWSRSETAQKAFILLQQALCQSCCCQKIVRKTDQLGSTTLDNANGAECSRFILLVIRGKQTVSFLKTGGERERVLVQCSKTSPQRFEQVNRGHEHGLSLPLPAVISPSTGQVDHQHLAGEKRPFQHSRLLSSARGEASPLVNHHWIGSLVRHYRGKTQLTTGPLRCSRWSARIAGATSKQTTGGVPAQHIASGILNHRAGRPPRERASR